MEITRTTKGEVKVLDNSYLVQCINGHVFAAELGSELEKRAKKRMDEGALDALPISSEGCSHCQEEREERGVPLREVLATRP
ncbi:MAG: hypothetical protein ABII13_04980 [Patescibacteria group bacterium]